MIRHIRMLLATVVVALGIFTVSTAIAQPVVHVSGRLANLLAPSDPNYLTPAIRVLSSDTLYQVSGDFIIGRLGVLVVAPGTHVQFLPNGRIIDSAGGKIIADGSMQVLQFDFTQPGALQTYCTPAYIDSKITASNQDLVPKAGVPYYFSIFYAANALPTGVTCSSPYMNPFVVRSPITFEGVAVNSNSSEWGNFLILPGADSAFFRDCQFINFRKDMAVEARTNLYYNWDVNPAGWQELLAKSNGTGAAVCTFSRKTYLRGCTFRNNVARLHGGAVAFLEFVHPPAINRSAADLAANPPRLPVPASLIPDDDGRIALATADAFGTQVNNLTFDNNSVVNNFAQQALVQPDTLSEYYALGYTFLNRSADTNACDGGAVYISGVKTRLGLTIGSIQPVDQWVFSGNFVQNNQVAGSFTEGARGGAVFVDSLTSLTIYNGTFLSNNALTPSNDATVSNPMIQKMALGGAIYSDSALNIFTNNLFSANTAGYGGAIYLKGHQSDTSVGRMLQIGGTITFGENSVAQVGSEIVFSSNTARYFGGAIYTYANTNIISGDGIDETQVQKVWFDQNVAGWAGGAVYSEDVLSLVNWTRFTNNSVHAADNTATYRNGVLGGGAVYALSAAVVKGTDFISNHADTANGGAIYLSNPPAVNRTFKDSTVSFIVGADTVADQRELTRFIQNTATRDTSNNSNSARLQKSGLGGAIFVTVAANIISFARTDSTFFSRVRFEQNRSYSGAAVYSDLYDMRLVMSSCLVTNNFAVSPIERNRDTISGKSSVIAGAIMFGEFEGPLPSYSGSYRGNAVYDNDARFIFRLPESPIPGNSGAGGADTLRGNFWGDGTNSPDGGIKGSPNVRVSQYNPLIPVNTFFVGTLPNSCLMQLPLESEGTAPNTFTYNPIPIGQIPDTLLFEGRVYDLFDRGTDIKTADYNNRINSPIQNFSVASPSFLMSNLGPAKNQNVRRLTRDPYLADVNSDYAKYQTDFIGNHPLGYPLFLQAFGDPQTNTNRSNIDPYARNYEIFYVLNKSTGEVVRLNLKETDIATNEFRGRLDFVPDFAGRDTLQRRIVENRPIFDVLQLGPLARNESTLDLRISAAGQYNDSVALGGRRTEGLPSLFGSGDFTYSNAVTPPFVRYYSGERYNALAVLTGDQIVVFSRMVLYTEGYVPSFTRGLQFSIGDVQKPAMRGYNVWTAVDPINPNRRFIKEDVKYPANGLSFTFPNLPVFTVAGVDTNDFYNPQWLKNANTNTQLSFSWDVLADADIATRVKSWLKDSIFYGPYSEKIAFPHGKSPVTYTYDTLTGSNGYLRLWGQPHNADVIPGGVTIHVSIDNYVPSKQVEALAESAGDSNNSIFVYPPYLACNHLQQDTVQIRSQDTSYNFTLFVQDSSPVYTNQPELIANLTDQLRYCWDANTDDEFEDSVAKSTGWNFRFGKTQYSFGDPLDPSVAKIQPQWMLNGFMKNAADSADPVGQAFASIGLLKVESDSATAIRMLTPTPPVQDELVLDTVVSVVVHDGHSGLSRKTYAVHVNVQPYVVNDNLPSAKEDEDYNVTMLDTTHAIIAKDPNIGDELTYYLVYRNSDLNTSLLDQTLFPGVFKVDSTNSYLLRRDNKYYGTTACTFTDVPQVMAHLTTPSWLKINPVSGILYGTPGLNDAPHSTQARTAPDTVTVVVRDPNGLIAVKELILNVDSTNHVPQFTNEPAVLCNLVGDSVSQVLNLTDIDLGRIKPFNDTLRLSVDQPAGGVTISPAIIVGAGDSVMKNASVTVNMSFTNPIGGQVEVIVRVTDAAGAYSTRKIFVDVSRKPAWRMNVTVGNNSGAYQQLTFGAGYRATRLLDVDYCEFALPPIPPRDVFDARWELTDSNGTVGSIRDFRDSSLTSISTYQSLVQAGGNNSIENYPIFISWRKSDCPNNAGALKLMDRFGGQVFNINMSSAAGFLGPQVQLINVDADQVKLQISNTQVTGFFITQDPLSGVSEIQEVPTSFELSQNYPNPFNPTTNIRFAIPSEQQTRLEVIDVMGRVIATLVNDKMTAGTYNVTWDSADQFGNGVSSGVYFYRLSAGSFIEMKQMTFMK